jgi:VanZ family protein
MLKPIHFVTAARVVLLVGSLAVTVLALGPFQGAEKIFGLSDKAAHAIALGGLLAIAFLAFPRMRRADLTIAALALGGAIEAAQLFDSRSASVLDWLADAAGILAVYAVSMTETIRRTARVQGDRTFAEIAAADRRQVSRRQAKVLEPAAAAEEAKERALSFAERAARRFPRHVR